MKKEMIKPVYAITECCKAPLASIYANGARRTICSACGSNDIPRHHQNGHALSCFCDQCQPQPSTK